MRLDDNIQPPCANKAVCAWEREAEGSHDFRNTDCCRARDPHAAMDKSCSIVPFSSI